MRMTLFPGCEHDIVLSMLPWHYFQYVRITLFSECVHDIVLRMFTSHYSQDVCMTLFSVCECMYMTLFSDCVHDNVYCGFGFSCGRWGRWLQCMVRNTLCMKPSGSGVTDEQFPFHGLSGQIRLRTSVRFNISASSDKETD